MEVELVEELGADTFVYGIIPGDTDARALRLPTAGARLARLSAKPCTSPSTTDELHVFDPTTGDRLG